MTNVIRKYPVSLQNYNEIELPAGAKFLHLGYQTLREQIFLGTNRKVVPSIWFEVDLNVIPETRGFMFFCTGEEVTRGFQGNHLATMIDKDDFHVWHLYECI